MSFAPETEPLAKPEALLRVPVGLASPLWGLFAGAAMSGAAWWWMTRWTRPANLEAMFGAAAETEAAIEPELATPAAPVEAALEAAVESTPESMVETVAQSTPEPVVETLAAEPIVAAPLAPEPAAAEPIAELAPTPKLKKKAAAPKAD